MNFLNPVFLFALAASALPVIIHLLSRRKQREVPFSTLRFLSKSDRRSMRRINLRRMILLALRVAAIALIALAFARPVITGRSASLFPGSQPKAVVVMIDRSYSMGARGAEGTAFDAARGAALEIAGGLGGDDELAVVLFDEGTEEVLSAQKAGRSRVEEALAGAAPSLKGTNLRRALDVGREALSSGRIQARELFIISDFQRSAALGSGGARATAAERVFLVQVAGGRSPNVSVSEVLLPGAAVHRGESVGARALVKNNSSDAPSTFDLRVDLDGERIIEKEITLRPGASIEEAFEFDAPRAGWIRGSVSCSEDILPADDIRLFTLCAGERTPVLLIAGAGAFYLRQALLPEGADGDIELVEKSWSGYTTADLARADVVVAGPGGTPGTNDAALLRRYAEGGGRLVVFISPGMERLAESISSRDLKVSQRGGKSGFMELEKPAGGSALLAAFGEDDLDGLSKLRFYRIFDVAGQPGGSAVLSFSGGGPYIWGERAGEGELLFAAAEPSPEAGDLVLSPYFLPLVQSMALAQLGVSQRRGGSLVGGSVALPMQAAAECAITLPGGIEYDYAAEPGAEGKISVPAGDVQGYLVARCGGDEWETAVNPDCARESDLSLMTPEEAADSLGLDTYAAAGAGEGMAERIREAREGREIADLLIVLAAALLAAELAVAQAPGGSRREEEP